MEKSSKKPRAPIPDEQREVMLKHSLQTRRRLKEFAVQHNLSAPVLRHMYVESHMPPAIWEAFKASGIAVPYCWNKDVVEWTDPHNPVCEDPPFRCPICPRRDREEPLI